MAHTPGYAPKRLPHYRVQVRVGYAKGRGIYASAYLAELKPGGSVMLAVTSGLSLQLEAAARLNGKRVTGFPLPTSRFFSSKPRWISASRVSPRRAPCSPGSRLPYKMN